MSYLANETTARLVVTCDDKPGIVCKITQFLFHHHANITCLDQHSTDPKNGTFFLRLEFQTPYLDLPKDVLAKRFEEEVAKPLGISFRFSYASEFKRMALLVSKHDHAFLDLLWRYARNELPIEIPMIISNHEDLKEHADNFKVPFYHVPNTKDTRKEAESKMLELMKDKVDGVILARYMQILSSEFVSHYPNNIINIHHSFLPAFVGADPYKQAYDKGVKLIGATAHYVTEDLDMGPIIGQDVAPVTHRLDPAHLRELGKDIERRVLAKAVRWHLEDRIIVDGNKTIVFN